MIVYRSTSKTTGKSYVGKTIKTFGKRKSEHKAESRLCRKNYHFYNAITKYGWDDFEWEVICECDTVDELNDKEQYYIMLYDTISNGYNMTAGGEGVNGWTHSEEWKEYMRTNNPMFNEETRIKMADSQRGKYMGSWEERFGIDKSNEMRDSQSKRMSENNPMFDPDVVKKVTEKKKDYYKSEAFLEFRKRHNETLGKEWYVTTPDGDEIMVKNLYRFCKERGLNSSTLSQVALGNRKQHKGYKCRPKGE